MLIVQQAVCIAHDDGDDEYEFMEASIGGCIFFGTPFRGSDYFAKLASFAHEGEHPTALLDFLKPEAEQLRGLRERFLQVISKRYPRAELFCFWESKPADYQRILKNAPNLEKYLKEHLPEVGKGELNLRYLKKLTLI
jgi:hypothetical protein